MGEPTNPRPANGTGTEASKNTSTTSYSVESVHHLHSFTFRVHSGKRRLLTVAPCEKPVEICDGFPQLSAETSEPRSIS